MLSLTVIARNGRNALRTKPFVRERYANNTASLKSITACDIKPRFVHLRNQP